MKAKLRLWFFVIRWFFIGKMHCDIPQSYKKYFKLGFYITWTIFIVAVVRLIQEILQYIRGFLV